MTDLLYTKISRTLKNTPFAPQAFLVLTIIMLVFGAMLFEDYMTSVEGYKSFPSAKVFSIVIWLVASLPQLFQMVTIYIIVGFSTVPKEERYFYGVDIIVVAVIAYILSWLLDGYWDYTYKITGYVGIPPGYGGIYWDVVLESFGLYGIGSEVASTVFGGIWVAMFREGAFKDLIELIFEIIESVADVVEKILVFAGKLLDSILKGFGVKKSDNKSKKSGKQSNSGSQNSGNQQKQQGNQSYRNNRPLL